VSAGACGALAPELAEGALVIPDTVLDEDGRRVATSPLAGMDARGTLVTVTRVLASAADKARLWIETGAIACDMESMAIVRWAHARGAAAIVVRGVSDTADHGVPADLAGVVSDDGRVRTVAAMRVALSRRGAIKDALALRRGTNAALQSVATALAKAASV
jgi:adenosylhomocysteine nucleosidase